jgi:predicted transcriptional regulator
MIQENMTYFTEKENEIVNLLIKIGMKQNVAKVLVVLANTPESTSRAIERGTDLRQPEVSIAVHYLMEQDWIRSHKSKAECKGRLLKIYALVKPFSEIIDSIEDERRKEAARQIQIIQKLRNWVL